MSKLNANAFSFVPGQGFRPPSQPQAPLPPPIERPEVTEAPRPPPTISLNIGSSTPAPTPAPAPQAPAPAPTSVAPAVPTPPPKQAEAPEKPVASSATKPNTYSLERAKNDTHAVAQEVKASVDEETLKDLYGHSTYGLPVLFVDLTC